MLLLTTFTGAYAARHQEEAHGQETGSKQSNGQISTEQSDNSFAEHCIRMQFIHLTSSKDYQDYETVRTVGFRVADAFSDETPWQMITGDKFNAVSLLEVMAFTDKVRDVGSGRLLANSRVG